jgi:hypothetical protein
MVNKNIQVCIIDDSLPFQNLTVKVDESKLIKSKNIESLIDKRVVWHNEPYLKELFSLILRSPYYRSEKIILNWALHPSFSINSIRQENYKPDLIIFDWEFLNFQSLNRNADEEAFKIADELKIMLELLPHAFFFVYSNVASQIPIYLFKKELDKYAHRFQVLPKGNHRLILSSEELIYDYILLKIDDKPFLEIGEEKVLFTKSTHLRDYKDILHLEFILGKESLKAELKKHGNQISEKTVREMLQDFDFVLYLSNNKKLLISEDSDYFTQNFGPLSTITYGEVFERFGLLALSGVLNDNTFKL